MPSISFIIQDHCWLIYVAAMKGRSEILCTPSSRVKAPLSPAESQKVYARHRLPETLCAIIQPKEACSEPELEVTRLRVESMDSYLTSLVLMLTNRPEWFAIWANDMATAWLES